MENFTLVVDTSICKGKVDVLFPGLKEKDNKFFVQLENFDLKNADDIQVNYRPCWESSTEMRLNEYSERTVRMGNYYTFSGYKQPPMDTTLFEKKFENKHVKDVVASSSLKGNYQPDNLFDGDIKKAWCEGAKEHGIGEWIDIAIDDKKLVTSIKMANGYMKSKKLYFANSRLKKIKLQIDNDKEKIIALDDVPYPGCHKADVDCFLTEIIRFNSPRLITKARITILQVYPGTKYKDNCVSELKLF